MPVNLAGDQSPRLYPFRSGTRAHFEAVRGKKSAELPEAGILDQFSAKKAVWFFVRPFDDLLKTEQ